MPKKSSVTLALREVFPIFLRLGLTSFGGPVAHIGYFRHEFVERRKWLDEKAYADLVSLCQFLPGPSSSQVGIALGEARAGILGAFMAWLGFTLPSAAALTLCGLGFTAINKTLGLGWTHGLKVVAVAVVAQALWSMSKTLTPDRLRLAMAVIAAATALQFHSSAGQIAIILAGAAIGCFFLKPAQQLPHTPLRATSGKRAGIIMLSAFFALLFLLPVAAAQTNNYALQLFSDFYRVGSLVFGGGHVVLPLLQSDVVPKGWVSNDAFLAGYGLAQAVPGPLFTLAAFLGSVSTRTPSGIIGGIIALAGIYLPSFLLLIGILPFWEKLRVHPLIQRAMMGVNAVVVGILLAAFYNPVWTSAIHNGADFSLMIAAFLALQFWKFPSWAVVALAAVLNGLINIF